MSGAFQEIVVPQMGVNDSSATLVAWQLEDGARAASGEVLCTLETTKTTLDLEVEREGFLLHLVEEGAQVAVGGSIALIGDELAALEAERERRRSRPEGQRPRATRKAERLAAELGVDLGAIRSDEILREEDVRRAAGASGAARDAVSPVREDEEGFVDPGFLREVESDPAFAALPGPRKLELYREHGARIGEGVTLGEGVRLFAQVLRLGDGVSIGDGAALRAQRLELGPMVLLGAGTKLSTREVVLGDVTYVGEGVLIGGGGAWGPRSSLRTGHSCLVSSRCILNCGEPIRIGSEVGLSPGVQLYTHNHWQSVLEGYPARHAPITLEDKVYLTGNVLVAPGVRVGRGATVLANSLVADDVPERAVMAGVPARRVGQTEGNLSRSRKRQIVERLMEELGEHLRFLGLPDHQVRFLESVPGGELPEGTGVLLGFEVEEAEAGDDLVVFDLEALQVRGRQNRLSDEVRNFLRRRGIRFSPIHWRYTHDSDRVVQ
jgi:acetyltransferase-like isoleucine patch superfamily enzyme